MCNKSKLLMWGLLIFLFTSNSFAQQYGRNKIQYEKKNWKLLQSEHFDIYFYQGGKDLAEFVAGTAESSYVDLSRDFDYKLIARIPIVVYRSHNDFSETNISSQVVGESVGGFTEFLKDRVIIPFEGSYEKFRHVIHHELTHAVMLQMLYGAGSGAILRGVSKMSPPLWFNEGLAEYESLGWDTDSDMFVRDATLHGYLPPIPYLQAFMAYKGGQSVMLYLEDTYGPHKLSELLHRMRHSRSFKKAWQQALNEPLEETSKKWQRYMRKKYWPEIANRKEPSDYALALTDHEKWRNFINNSPALAPKGDRIAFLSDRSGYFDIYLTSVTEPKKVTRLVAGQRKSNLEELHWLQPGMSWSPDGRFIAFAARAGKEDALNIIDVNRKKIVHTFKFGLDGLFSPAWSPTNNEIAFVGIKNSQSDIYLYNLDTEKLTHVTDDVFSDLDPAWSPDGNDLVFASDRKENVEPKELRKPVHMVGFDYKTTDIYFVHKNGAGMQRLTTSPHNELSPQWTADGKHLLYVSDKSGISNIYSLNPETLEDEAMTNLITGCAQLSWGSNSNRLAFTAFSNGGYDIFVWANPFGTQNKIEQPVKTAFIKELDAGRRIPEIPQKNGEGKIIVKQVQEEQDFSDYVFGDDFRRGKIAVANADSQSIKLAPQDYKENGEYKVHKYKTKFGIDHVGVNAGYDPIFGMQGLTELSASDVLGDHQLTLGINFVRDFLNSDFLFSYLNQKNRLNWSVSASQFVFFYATNLGYVRFANRGASFRASYPMTRFKRIDLGLQYVNIQQDYLNFAFLPGYSTSVLMPSLSFTKDNSIPGYTAPSDGQRYYASISGSPKVGTSGREFISTYADLRRYLAINRDFSFALRLSGGANFGKNPPLFILGGMHNWLNYRYSTNLDVTTIGDYFLSNLMMPLRGADLYQMVGDRAFLLNFEFRFPLIQYFVTRFPLPLAFQNIRGLFFWDAGSAWMHGDNWKPFERTANNRFIARDLVNGFGYGVRINVGFFLMRFDAAWQTDFSHTSSPRFYYSIGADF